MLIYCDHFLTFLFSHLFLIYQVLVFDLLVPIYYYNNITIYKDTMTMCVHLQNPN